MQMHDTLSSTYHYRLAGRGGGGIYWNRSDGVVCNESAYQPTFEMSIKLNIQLNFILKQFINAEELNSKYNQLMSAFCYFLNFEITIHIQLLLLCTQTGYETAW